MKIKKKLYEANRATTINLSFCYFFLDLLRSTTQSKTFSKANRRSTIITFAVGLSKYEHKMQFLHRQDTKGVDQKPYIEKRTYGTMNKRKRTKGQNISQ